MSFIDWFTNENNPKLDQSEYLYGTRHIVLLITTFILCLGIYFIFRKRSDKSKKILFSIFAFIFLFFEIASRTVNLIIAKTYTIESVAKILLPMHICSVMVWVFIIAIFTKKKILLNYSAIGGILATLAFLLYPAVGINQKYMAFTNIYSTFSHMLGFVTAISFITLKQTEFKFSKIWQPYLCFAIIFSYGALLNFVIFPGSDYMYMINDPLELNLNFPYQILYVALIAIYTSLFYVFSSFKRKEKKEIIEEVKEESLEEIIIKTIKNNPKFTKREYAEILNIDLVNLEKHIVRLKKDGVLERVGPSKGGYWKVN